MSALDIIIVSYNTRAHLEACLRSLHDPAPQVAHEVTVVDNASTDGSVEAVRSRWHEVRLIEAGENIGYARANNLAIRQTTRDLVLLLNSDTVVPAGAVDRLVDLLDAADDVVGGRTAPSRCGGTRRAVVRTDESAYSASSSRSVREPRWRDRHRSSPRGSSRR